MKFSKTAKKIWSIFTSTIVSIVVIVAILLVGFRLCGFKTFTVISGSMEPVYHVGSLIYVKQTDAEDIEVGDPITFVLNEDLLVATHRVVRIDEENQRFYTKGDANEFEDGAPVHFNNLIGKPVFSIPYLGYAADFIKEPPGLYITIAGGAFLLLLMFLPDLVKAWNKDEVSSNKEQKSK